MAAVNSRKMKFSLLRGSFGTQGINEYLRELAVGRGSTAPIKNAKLPTVEDREKWDGKDGEVRGSFSSFFYVEFVSHNYDLISL